MIITDLISEYGAYYEGKNSQANKQRILSLLFVPETFGKLFTLQPTDATIWKGAIASIGQVVQQFQKAYTPISNAELKPKTILLEQVKVDLDENPSELEDSWAGFLTRLAMEKSSGLNTLRTEWPFIRWYLETLVIPRVKEQLEMSEYFWGVRGAVTPGTATAEGESLTGINKKIDDDAAGAALMNHLSLGAYPTDAADFVKFIEEFVDQVMVDSPKLRSLEMDIMMNSALEMLYKRGYRELYGRDLDQASLSVNNKKVIDTRVNLIGCTAMDNDPANPGESSDKLIMTYAANRVRPITFAQNASLFSVDKAGSNPRGIWAYTDWHEAVDFGLYQHVFVGNSETPTP